MISEAHMPSDLRWLVIEKVWRGLPLNQVHLLQLCIFISHSVSTSVLPVHPSLCLSATHTPLHLVFKSIHYPSEWDLPPERVNNVWQRDREAYRMEDSLASISILSVSEGNREHQGGGCWDSLPQLTASALLRAAGFRTWSPSFFYISTYYHPKQEHASPVERWEKLSAFMSSLVCMSLNSFLFLSSVKNLRSWVYNGPSLLFNSWKWFYGSHEHVWTCCYLELI